jgi:hypothetical protein
MGGLLDLNRHMFLILRYSTLYIERRLNHHKGTWPRPGGYRYKLDRRQVASSERNFACLPFSSLDKLREKISNWRYWVRENTTTADR